jgi:putative oxidoreductase
MIRSIFNYGNYTPRINVVLLLLRLSTGVFMLTHGIGKVSRLFGDDPIKFADPLGVGTTASLALVVFAEVVCSVFLIFGFLTRLVSVPLFFTMFMVVFIVKANKEFSEIELPLFYMIVYVCIAIAGAGKYSVDNLIYKKSLSVSP